MNIKDEYAKGKEEYPQKQPTTCLACHFDILILLKKTQACVKFKLSNVWYAQQ